MAIPYSSERPKGVCSRLLAEPVWYGRSPSLQVSTSPAALEEVIRTPGLFYAAGEDRHWLAGADGGQRAYNLWNAAEAATNRNYGPVVKTIYDPSPAGAGSLGRRQVINPFGKLSKHVNRRQPSRR